MLQIKIITENQDIAAICKLYWTLDSNSNFLHNVDELGKLAQIDKSKIPGIVKKSCNVYINDWICENCESPHIFSNRSDFLGKRNFLLNGLYLQNLFICDECKKKQREIELEEKRVKAELEKKAREAIEIELQKKIQNAYSLSKRPFLEIQSLSLTDIVYLISILRGGADESLTKIAPISTFIQSLSPDDNFSSSIINYLHNNELIFIHPDSAPSSFANDDLSSFYIYEVCYAPPISQLSTDNPKALLVELLKIINEDWTEEWCQDALIIWKRIALAECKEYLILSLNEHHFDFSPGEKTTQYLEYALENFSTAQVYNIIWRAVRDAAARYQRGGVTKKHAANIAISAIQGNTERAVAENWEMKPYGRNYKCPQSIISEVYYNLALKLGDDGFKTTPNIKTIRSKKLDSN